MLPLDKLLNPCGSYCYKNSVMFIVMSHEKLKFYWKTLFFCVGESFPKLASLVLPSQWRFVNCMLFKT